MKTAKSGIITSATAALALSCAARDVSAPQDQASDLGAPSQALYLADGDEAKSPDEMFCTGLRNVLQVTKQPITGYFDAFCASDSEISPAFKSLMETPYAGGNDLTSFSDLIRAAENARRAANNQGPRAADDFSFYYNAGTKTIEMRIAFLLKIAKKPVPVLLGEEQFIQNTRFFQRPNQAEKGLGVNFRFIDPPTNDNDCDTALRVVQTTTHDLDDVDFSEESVHDLKLYRMHPNNFDYLIAARTLVPNLQGNTNLEKPLFKDAMALRGVMPAPDGSSYSMTFIHLRLDRTAIDRNNDQVPERLAERLLSFVKNDMKTLYQFHNQEAGQ